MPLSDLERVCIREPTLSARCGVGISRLKRDLPPADYLFKIQSFPLAVEKRVKKYESNVFRAGGYSWKLVLYPNGKSKRNGKGNVSLYLAIADTEKLSRVWEVNVNFKLFVFDHNCNNYLTIQDADGVVRKFNEMKSEWGFEQLISLEELFDSSNGYLDEEDTCVFGAEVLVIGHSGNWESFDVAGEKPPTTNGSSTGSGKPKKSGCSTGGGKPQISGSSSISLKPSNFDSFSCKIENFSALDSVMHLRTSNITVGVREWMLMVSTQFPDADGNSGKHLVVKLKLNDWKSVHVYTKVQGSVKFKLLDQLNNKYHEKTEYFYSFISNSWVHSNLISISELKTGYTGYIMEDAIIVDVEISDICIV